MVVAQLGNRGFKKDNKYQGPQDGYELGYSEGECYSQFHYPAHGMSKSQKAYGMAETWDEYGQSYGSYTSQNGNATPKPQVHGRGNGFGSHSSNGTAHMQSYGFSNSTSHWRSEGRGCGYGVPNPAPGYQNNSDGMGHGFGNHRNYEITEAYGYDETNDYWEYANTGMARGQPHHPGKHSGHGNGFQACGSDKNLGFEFTDAEASEYRETNFSNESQYGDRARGYHDGNDHSVEGMPVKMKDRNSGDNSCSDSESYNNDDDYGIRKVWISKAI